MFNTRIHRCLRPLEDLIAKSRRCFSAGTLPSSGYKSMGSFHSDNVEILIRQDDCSYEKPRLPDVIKSKYDDIMRKAYPTKPSFGNDSKSLFMLESEYTFINHGAFGLTLRVAHDFCNAWREYAETQPLRYFDRHLLPHLVYSYRSFGKYVNCKPDQLALIPNATYGINSIVRSVVQNEDDHVLLLDLAYGAVKKIVETVCKEKGSKFDIVEVPLSMGSGVQGIDFETSLLQVLEKSITPKHKLIIFDHTTSNTAINLPIEKMATICKKYGGKVAIDGAHGLFARDIDISSLFDKYGVDFYVGNCHKWFCSTKGLGFICVKDTRIPGKNELVPCIISHGYGDGFTSNFIWDGCRDYTGALSVPFLLEFWNRYDMDSIRSYQASTLQDSLNMLTNMWHENRPSVTSQGSASDDMIVPFAYHSPMALIKLPKKWQIFDTNNGKFHATSSDAKAVQDYLYFEKKIEVPVKNIGNALYCRLSCHIYNSICDYKKLGEALL